MCARRPLTNGSAVQKQEEKGDRNSSINLTHKSPTDRTAACAEDFEN